MINAVNLSMCFGLLFVSFVKGWDDRRMGGWVWKVIYYIRSIIF